MIVHRVSSMQSAVIDGRVRYAARWLCSPSGTGSIDAIVVADPEPFGGICPRCESVLTGYVVYRCYDADDQLLYIGSTEDSRRRLRQHESLSSWWPEVTRVDMAQQPDGETAWRVEMHAIYDERPIHNKVFNRLKRVDDLIASDA